MTDDRAQHPEDGDTPAPAATPASGISRFASLTASLLARKGEAKPAMEPFSNARVAPGSARAMGRGERHKLDRRVNGEASSSPQRDGEDGVPRHAPHWELPHVNSPHDGAHRFSDQDAPYTQHFLTNGHDVCDAPHRDASGDAHCPRKTSARRAAVAVRMTTHDYLRLRLAAAELEVSAHDIVLAALDAYLDEKGVERFDECLCLQKTADKCEEIAVASEEKEGGADKPL